MSYEVKVVMSLFFLATLEQLRDSRAKHIYKLAEAVTGIDLIIDGHSHTYFDKPQYVNGTPIVSANEWGKFMGEGVFTIVNVV